MSEITLSSRTSTLARVPGVAWMLLAMLIVFTGLNRDFLGAGNMANIGLQSSILLMLALPMTLIIMTEGLDLSIGAVLTLCGVVLAWTLLRTGSLPLGLLAAGLCGLLFGFVNGGLVALLDMPPFVATLGTLGIAQGLALVLTDGQSIVGIDEAVGFFYSGSLGGIPFPILIAIGCYGCMHVLLYHTRFGTYVCAIGGNKEALQLAGVRANRYLIGVYCLGGAMAGFASLLLTARMSAAHPTAAIGMEFDAIAAVIVGGTSFERGNGWLFGTLLGVLTVGMLRNGLNLLAVPSSVQVTCIGLLVILALLIDGMKEKA
jgi:ribose transport system permease protein